MSMSNNKDSVIWFKRVGVVNVLSNDFIFSTTEQKIKKR